FVVGGVGRRCKVFCGVAAWAPTSRHYEGERVGEVAADLSKGGADNAPVTRRLRAARSDSRRNAGSGGKLSHLLCPHFARSVDRGNVCLNPRPRPPAVCFDRDQRSTHDRGRHTAAIRLCRSRQQPATRRRPTLQESGSVTKMTFSFTGEGE